MTTPDLSPEHRERLAALADLLDTVEPDRFDMDDWYIDGGDGGHDPHEATHLPHQCDTTGCALGWAVTLFPPLGDEDFYAFGQRVFGLIGVPGQSESAFRWLFDYRWESVDNTPRGAAARIRYMLEHGLPEDWREQMSGEAPLCYSTNEVRHG